MAISRRKAKPVLKEGEVVVETRPPVTQVVEVVEDQEQQDTITAQAESPAHTSLEDTPPDDNDGRQDDESVEEGEEKRRVLVDELFQKKDSRGPEMTPEISMHKRSPSRSILTWAIVSIVACIVVGGALFILSSKGTVTSMFVRATPTPIVTPTSEPTPKAELTRDAVTIQVLNGGGVAGAAGKMKTFLEGKGYIVKDTKNADNYDYVNTEILVKSDKVDYVKLLEEDLKESYSLGTSAGTLDADALYDVQVIVGGE